MSVVYSDLQAILLLLPPALLVVAVIAVLEWRGRYAPSRVLAGAEWLLLAKIVAIPLMIMILVLAKIAMHFPAEIFLYGRF